MQDALHILIDQIPRHSEEGNLSLSVPSVELKTILCQHSGYEPEAISTLIDILEYLFLSLRLLDEEAAGAGLWKFVSFAAQLVALSTLETLSDKTQYLLPKYFWTHDPIQQEAQRHILRTLETHRTQHHQSGNAKPIRFVYVAWGLIRTEAGFLLHHREDRHRVDAANYVPLGGRMHPLDLLLESTEECLNILQHPSSEMTREGLSRTLIREIEEETGLTPESYDFSLWRRLKPYRQVEGSGANHAYTEYDIAVYILALSNVAFLRLMRNFEARNTLGWFTPEELAHGQRSDGERAYVNALLADFENTDALQSSLEAITFSYRNTYRCDQPEWATDFGYHDPGLMVGSTGRERLMHISMDRADAMLLFALAWHARGFLWSELANDAYPLPQGWVALENASLQSRAKRLSRRLTEAGYPALDIVEERFFRLPLPPQLIFFESGLFNVDFKEEGLNYKLRLSVESLITPLGATAPLCRDIEITERLFNLLKKVARKAVYEHEAEHLAKQVRRDVEQEAGKFLGLRKFLRKQQNQYRLTCQSA